MATNNDTGPTLHHDRAGAFHRPLLLLLRVSLANTGASSRREPRKCKNVRGRSPSTKCAVWESQRDGNREQHPACSCTQPRVCKDSLYCLTRPDSCPRPALPSQWDAERLMCQVDAWYTAKRDAEFTQRTRDRAEYRFWRRWFKRVRTEIAQAAKQGIVLKPHGDYRKAASEKARAAHKAQLKAAKAKATLIGVEGTTAIVQVVCALVSCLLILSELLSRAVRF